MNQPPLRAAAEGAAAEGGLKAVAVAVGETAILRQPPPLPLQQVFQQAWRGDVSKMTVPPTARRQASSRAKVKTHPYGLSFSMLALITSDCVDRP